MSVTRIVEKLQWQEQDLSNKNSFDPPYWQAAKVTPNRPSRYFPKYEELELFNFHFVVRTLKQDCMPNFSKIGEVQWPAKV